MQQAYSLLPASEDHELPLDQAGHGHRLADATQTRQFRISMDCRLRCASWDASSAHCMRSTGCRTSGTGGPLVFSAISDGRQSQRRRGRDFVRIIRPKRSGFRHVCSWVYENRLTVFRMQAIIRTPLSDEIRPMPRVFAYCRVSTVDQTTQNQSMEVKAAGFAIEARRLIEENISGSVTAKERPA